MKGRFEAGDLLAFLYALVLIRQAFWLVPENIAWPASIGAAALLGVLRLRSRRSRPPLPAAFWLCTAAPLALFWFMHLPYPDVGFDNLNYHILHGERALRGLLAIPGDFQPHYFPSLNPAPDMLAALLRTLLGYRLGTVGSILALVWTGAILFRALERAIDSRVLRALAALWIVCSEGVLWEAGNYMVDLFGLPLLLEAALLALPGEEDARDPLEDLPLVGALLGSAVAFKLTNIVFAAAIGVVLMFRVFGGPSRRRDARRVAGRVALAALAFLLPSAPHTLLLWWTTGSPLFPHFNSLFRSPLFPLFNVFDGRFGPLSSLEKVAWPVVSVLHPERLGELGATSGRLALGFLGAIAALLIPPRDRWLRGLAVIVILGALLWSFGSGIQRYGLFVELAGGLAFVVLWARGIAVASGRGLALRLLAFLPVALLGAQSLFILKLAKRGDWSGRPTLLYQPDIARKEFRRVGFDHDFQTDLPNGLRDALPTFAGWVDVAPRTNGLMALLAPRLPMIGLAVAPYFETPDNLARYDQALRALEGRPLASLASVEDLHDARRELARNGFLIRRETSYEVPFFSSYTNLAIVALELEAPPPLPVQSGETARVLSARELVLRRPPATARAWREDVELPGTVESPGDGEEVRGSFAVRGWARAPGHDLSVRVFLDGVERRPDEFSRIPRPDVAAAVPGLGPCATAGYEALLATRPADAGVHVLSILFRSRDGRERHVPGRRIVLAP